MNVVTASEPYATGSSVEPNSPSAFLYTMALSDLANAAPPSHPGAYCCTLANASLISEATREGVSCRSALLGPCMLRAQRTRFRRLAPCHLA